MPCLRSSPQTRRAAVRASASGKPECSPTRQAGGAGTDSTACNAGAGFSVSGDEGTSCWAEIGEVTEKAVRQASRNLSISISVPCGSRAFSRFGRTEQGPGLITEKQNSKFQETPVPDSPWREVRFSCPRLTPLAGGRAPAGIRGMPQPLNGIKTLIEGSFASFPRPAGKRPEDRGSTANGGCTVSPGLSVTPMPGPFLPSRGKSGPRTGRRGSTAAGYRRSPATASGCSNTLRRGS